MIKTKFILSIALLSGIVFLSGCGTPQKHTSYRDKENVLLTVDWKNGENISYKLISDRKTKVTFGKETSSEETSTEIFEEHLELIMDYTPVANQQYESSKVEATCRSVNAYRKKDGKSYPTAAVESLEGQSFEITVSPSGKITEFSEFEKLLKQAGEKAFTSGDGANRVKNADLLGDFTLFGLFLWDSVASMPTPLEGVEVGQSWSSVLPVPGPMIKRIPRAVTYQLSGIKNTDKGKIAVIKSHFEKGDKKGNKWPLPYEGSFRMKGTFGFLRNYRVKELQGQGRERFDIQAGRVLNFEHNYRALLDVSLMLPVTDAKVEINQQISAELL